MAIEVAKKPGKLVEMKWYKYTSSSVADRMLEGNIRVTRLSQYNDTENLGNAVGDSGEATEETEVDYFNSGPAGTKFENALIQSAGSNIVIANTNLQWTRQDLFGFCASSSLDRRIQDRFTAENEAVGLSAYDDCVAIDDSVAFRKAVADAARTKNLDLVAWGNCVYDRKSVNYRETRRINAGMLKPSDQEWQKEVRVVFATRDSRVEANYFDLSVPEIVHILSRASDNDE